MIGISTGYVKKIIKKKKDLTEILVEVEEKEEKALNFNQLTGEVAAGDLVILNTTAFDLGLGTGGYHLVMGVLFKGRTPKRSSGHIIKLRYTPYQFPVLAVEEEASKDREKIERFKGLEKMPVIVGTLHSQLAPAAAVIKKLSKSLKIAYLMTDKASLPLALSSLVDELKSKGLIFATITSGQAFGGDYEAVNIYTGLICAKLVVRADVTIVTQGLGSVGTGTKYGFSGIEQGEIINAVSILGGSPIAIPRVSFADKRERHQGVSEHTLVALGEVALLPALVSVPEVEEEKLGRILSQLGSRGVREKHLIRVIKADIALDALKEEGIEVTTMGRKVEEDREFFLSAGAAGILAVELLRGRRGEVIGER
ncbi:MAG: DUF3866 domain-containing protein [Armatimonadetes bacterium CG07_land_8_20_14_0_80_40_9]|nr:MAG: DUF3866 domain-containing protein [Armatimonadetes bacterium CG07_land_8_20_14_0_80_40_9]